MTEETRITVEREDGQTMAEYAITLGVIIIAVVATFGVFGGAVSDLIGAVADLFS
jgi:Flp pilus assembly pilin Flp